MDLYFHAKGKDGRVHSQPGRRRKADDDWEGFTPYSQFGSGIDPNMEMETRVGVDTPYEEAERIALSMAASFGMTREQIDELRERKRREYASRTGTSGQSPAGEQPGTPAGSEQPGQTSE